MTGLIKTLVQKRQADKTREGPRPIETRKTTKDEAIHEQGKEDKTEKDKIDSRDKTTPETTTGGRSLSKTRSFQAM